MATYQKKTSNGQAAWDSSMTLAYVGRPNLPLEYEVVDVVYRDDNDSNRRFTLRLFDDQAYDLMRALAVRMYAVSVADGDVRAQKLFEAIEALHPTTGEAGK